MNLKNKKILNYFFSLVIIIIFSIIISGCNEDAPYNVSGQVFDSEDIPLNAVKLYFTGEHIEDFVIDVPENGEWSAIAEGQVIITPVKGDLLFNPETKIVVQERNDIVFKGYEPQVEDYINFLKDSQPAVRQQACEALGNMGYDAIKAVSSLINAMEDEVESVQKAAKNAMLKIGPQVIPELDKMMEKQSQETRELRLKIVMVLEKIGSEAIETLIKSLEDEHDMIRREVIQALLNLDEQRKEIVSALGKVLLFDPNVDIRKEVAELLVEMIPEVEEAIVYLAMATGDREVSVAWVAVRTFRFIGSEVNEQSVSGLLEYLQGVEQRKSRIAARALRFIGVNIENKDIIQEITSALIDQIGESEIDVSLEVIKTLGEFKNKDEQVVDKLKELLQAEDIRLQKTAAKILGIEVEAIKKTIEFQVSDYALMTDNQYTPIVTYNNNIYFIWVNGDSRAMVSKINETSGEIITYPLDPNPDYKVYAEDGHHKFSLGIDKHGYIHIVGDLHHGGNPWYRQNSDNPLPERYRGSQGGILYWVSTNPEDISSFSFMGHDIERVIPSQSASYLNFKTDNYGVLYASARANLHPKRANMHRDLGFGLYRYDVNNKRWTALGALAPDQNSETKTVLWSPEGGAREGLGWYQAYQANIQFDYNNRLHLSVGVNAVKYEQDVTHIIYAYSDDGGETFYRADGSLIETLPIIPEPGTQQGSIVHTYQGTGGINGLWGYVFYNSNGVPAVAYDNRYSYFQPTINNWSQPIDSPAGGSIRLKNYTDPAGILTFIGVDKIYRTVEYDFEGKAYPVSGWLRSIDESLLREKGIFRGVVEKDGKMMIKTIEFERARR